MSETVARECGITYRMLDYWVSHGWVRPIHDGGSGNNRWWPATELVIATDMGQLTRAGLMPEAAHRVARAGLTPRVLALLAAAEQAVAA